MFALSQRTYVSVDKAKVCQVAERCAAFHYAWAKQMGIVKVGPYGDLTFDALFNSSYRFGTPEECLEMLEELQAMGIHEINCNLDFAGMLEHRRALRSMELFASKVTVPLV